MSYQVLARKWRPRNFSQLAGQEHVVQALSNALTQQRLHHAYLLTGTRGVGKTTIARILAKSLNCETGITATPCGVCGACTSIDEGRFVDLIELDAASSTGIDNMREILDTARYAPTVGRYKVYLIDEVHMLSKSAFNSMLKTLEEPPEHVKFVLATTDPQKIPITVLSRCLQFNLKQMPPAVVAKHLEHVLAQEGIAFEPGAIRVLSRAAQGSMRDGLSLLDQAIAYGGGGAAGVQEAPVRAMLGAVETDYVLRLLEALARGDGPVLVAETRAMSERNIALDAALQDLGVALHDIALLQTVPAAVADDHPGRERLAELAHLLDPETVQLYYQIAIQGRTDLPLAPDEYAGFSMTMLRMLAFAPQSASKEPTSAGTCATAAGPARAARSVNASTVRSANVASPTDRGDRPAGPVAGATPGSRLAERPSAAAAATTAAASTSTSTSRSPLPSASRSPLSAVPRTAPVGPPSSGPAPGSPPSPGSPASSASPARTAAAVASDLLAAVSSAAQASMQSTVAAPAATATPSEPTGVVPDSIAQAANRIADWHAWVGGAGLNGLAYQLAYNTELKAGRATPTGLEVDLGLAESQRHLAERMHQDKLRDALANTLGVAVRVAIEVGGAGEASAAAADRRARAKAQDDATASFNADPFVRDALALFEGRVRPQTIQPVSGPEANKETKR